MSLIGAVARGGTRTRIVAVFASEEDRGRVTPRGRTLGRLDDRTVRPSPRLIVAGAGLGCVLAGALAGLSAWAIVRLTGQTVSAGVIAFAAGLAALLGGIAGMVILGRTAAAFAREVNAHLTRGRAVVLVECDPADAGKLARRFEQQGALEATILPPGLVIEPGEVAVLDLDRARASHGTRGATLISGGPLLASAMRRFDAEDVTVCVLGRDGHVGPVHSSTAGPAWVHEIPPQSGENWWRALRDRHGKALHVRFADGELVLVGEATRQLVPILSGHVNDAISSALARIAEAFGCPDASARIVIDQVDGGAVGVVVVGDLDARRRAVERISRAASATSEGTAALPLRASRRVRRVA